MKCLQSKTGVFSLCQSMAVFMAIQFLLCGLPDQLSSQAEKTRGSLNSRSGYPMLPQDGAPARPAPAVAEYGKLPLSFESNHGQADSRVKFMSRGQGHALFLTATEMVVALQDLGGDDRDADKVSEKTQSAFLRMTLVGANSAPAIDGLGELPGTNNYFIGNDPKNWLTNIPTFSKVRYQQVYSGIDMVYYGNQQQLEYDFILAPGADPKTIRIALNGADNIAIDAAGDLAIETSTGRIRQHRPVVYQEEGDSRKQIACRYSLKGEREIGFDVGAYDPTRPLIIDPVLTYATFIGGNAQDSPQDIAVDAQGNAYIVGWTFSYDFPITPGAFSAARAAFISKLNSTGTALLYSTFIGGTQSIDVAQSIAVDSSGNAFVTGHTTSSNFPTTPGAFQRQFHSQLRSAFVTKLNPTGTALVYSSFLGGNETDQASGIAIDAAGNAYITGTTYSLSSNFARFPVTAGAFQTVYRGGYNRFGGDGFVTKVNPTGTALLYSTYLGGSYDEGELRIALGSDGSAYVAGGTGSADFPTTPNAYQPTGENTGFITRLNAGGTGLVYSTYFRNAGISGIAVDAGGNAYVTGWAGTIEFHATPGAYQATAAGGFEGYVAKLNSTGTALIFATYIGGSKDDFCNAIALDSAGNVYLTGETWSSDYPTTPNAFQLHLSHDTWTDVFFSKLNASGTALIYSTYLGGHTVDYGRSVAVDALGNAYVTGEAGSPDFPSTPGTFQPIFNGQNFTDVFVAKFTGLSPFDLCIEDESNSSLLQINTTTGDYLFTNCGGLTLGGIGALTKRGSQITLQQNTTDRRVMAQIDTATNKAIASIQLLSTGRMFSITDRNITNNSCVCK